MFTSQFTNHVAVRRAAIALGFNFYRFSFHKNSQFKWFFSQGKQHELDQQDQNHRQEYIKQA